MNSRRKKLTDCITKAIHDLVECGKNLIAKSHLPNFFPDLLNLIHLWSIWRNIKQANIFGTMERAGFMPCCAVTTEEDNIIWILFGQTR